MILETFYVTNILTCYDKNAPWEALADLGKLAWDRNKNIFIFSWFEMQLMFSSVNHEHKR